MRIDRWPVFRGLSRSPTEPPSLKSRFAEEVAVFGDTSDRLVAISLERSPLELPADSYVRHSTAAIAATPEHFWPVVSSVASRAQPTAPSPRIARRLTSCTGRRNAPAAETVRFQNVITGRFQRCQDPGATPVALKQKDDALA